MTTFDSLMTRNQDFATHQFLTNSSLTHSLEGVLRSAKALIIACADPRDDPAYCWVSSPERPSCYATSVVESLRVRYR